MSEDDVTIGANTNTNFVIGALNTTPDHEFKGQIGTILIYDRRLKSYEVARLWRKLNFEFQD